MTPTAAHGRRFSRVYLEGVGGLAGDMLLAALLDLGADAGLVRSAVARIGEPGLSLEVSRVEVDGEAACHVRSIASSHGGHGRHLHEVLAFVDRAGLTPRARDAAGRIFDVLVRAEAACHGEPADQVHLHEVGELDSVLDVVGIAAAWDALGAPALDVGPLPSGRGTVATSHGTLTVPVPAVREIARAAGIPLVDVDVRGETVTPTGIAAAAALGRVQGAPLTARGEMVGVGAGTKRFPGRPNVVRLHGYYT
jgi:uncharacterized protein (DUF111 family)